VGRQREKSVGIEATRDVLGVERQVEMLVRLAAKEEGRRIERRRQVLGKR
jgi:hypothetical protein